MIRYRLRCADGHEFEAWFRGSADYDRQAERGLVVCALCGTEKVEKALMAPNVRTSGQRSAAPTDAPGPAPSPPATVPQPVAAHIPRQLLELMRQVRDHVRSTADYVGDKFADEARKIHYEEVEARGIYGEATAEEVRSLHEEGIEVHPMPVLPEDKN
jgi:hypothetical protein